MLRTGIDHSEKVIEDLGDLIVNGIEISKTGIGFGMMRKLGAIANEMVSLVCEAPLVLPELTDLSKEEAGKLMESSYVMVCKVIAAIKGT